MTAAQALSPEAEQNIARIVRMDLEPITAKGITISEIRVMPGEDQDGDPYHHIIVIYSGNDDLLDPAWLNGFKRRNREELAEWGGPHYDRVIRRRRRVVPGVERGILPRVATMNWEQLLELAEMLAGTPQHGETRGRPQQTHLRKANSTAY